MVLSYLKLKQSNAQILIWLRMIKILSVKIREHQLIKLPKKIFFRADYNATALLKAHYTT